MTPEKALQLLAGQCSKKEYCSREIREKLDRWGIPGKEKEKILTWLLQHRFVDDSRFARTYAEDKFRFNRWGKRKIALMLQQKGISEAFTAEALSLIGNEEYRTNCMDLLKQKRTLLPEQSAYELRARLTRFALGRGFDPDTIRQCLEKLL